MTQTGLSISLKQVGSTSLMTAALLAAISTASAQNQPATARPTLAQRCVANAAIARGIARDRDAGMLQGEEMRKLRERVEASGLQGEERLDAAAKQRVLVREIYTLYITVPPATIYSKYMSICAKMASNPQ